MEVPHVPVDVEATGAQSAARTQIRAHRRGTRSCDDQDRHQRPNLRDRTERRTGTAQVGSTELAQQDVERKN